jgi:hypothetical protein
MTKAKTKIWLLSEATHSDCCWYVLIRRRKNLEDLGTKKIADGYLTQLFDFRGSVLQDGFW